MMWSRRQIIQTLPLFCLGACVSTQTSQVTPSGKTKIIFWTMQLKPTFNDYMAALISEFGKVNPNAEVEWVDVPWADMEQKILSAIASGTAPDVANLNPQFATKLAEKNALVDMQTAIPTQAQALYFPNIWKANQLGAITFGLPWYVSTDVTIYNRDLFTKAGLTQPPQTYAQLVIAAQQIKAKTGKYAFMLTMDGTQVLESMVQMGMELLTPDRKAGFNTDVGKSAFKYWVNLFEQKLIPREVLTEGHRKAIELYQAGELAVLITGPQFLKLVAENAPNIAKVSDVAVQISGDTGKKSAAVMNVVVPKSSQSQDLALKFATFLTNDANQLSFSKVENSLPSTIQAAADPYFSQLPKDSSPFTKARIISASQLKQSEVLIPPVKNLENLRKIIYEELQLAMLKQKSSDEAIATAAERWDQLV
ncbi:ABC-type sugar transport system, periplasmic component [Synechococcus sp. PCC 7502]|uniref:ABC transporter substrate-binding protein n=1 Tax=Synechococcus sp. PCC 7502 TaxID=1173263 RepID=UPI00029FB95C|nr:sugar ABC transporter substrate-binding protein [Synechococcus sp. PCC 7502]AFY73989.1 ABC-type sugar transport system, periplasmic component [Synechococcus sp. PCC 7502]